MLVTIAITEVEVTDLRFEPASSQFANENSTTPSNWLFLAKWLRVGLRDAKLWV